MKPTSRLLTTVATLVLLHVFAAAALARAGGGITVRQRITTYGCLAASSASTASRSMEVFVKTGWQTLDTSLYWDIGELNRQFGVSVPVYFIKTSDDEKNAFFTGQKFPDLIRAEGADPSMSVTGSVFITSGLLKNEFRSGGYAIPAILGHEYAHAMQYANRFAYSGKWQELHADYLAGWFTAHRQRHLPQDADQALKSFFDKGDFDFFEEGHHGTPQERANAFYAGYLLNMRAGVASGGIAYNNGINYVRASGGR
jgi:hypothetical protein